ncbi:hypothetical protein FSARC_4295 [Fusarium sarcochroum]|uniref:Ankyrin n=1 Tax=Fusarium sarcochroum TaxID=1208366 RepID=A0A8H4U2M8_9HYPO|nr:hypothetical protein FSARC_4295 [Fusarium sarcochroum]
MPSELGDDGDGQKRTKLSEAIIQETDVLEIEAIISEEPWAIDIHDEAGFPPLCLAVQTKRLDVVRLLLAQGANINGHCYVGQTALMMAVDYDLVEVVRLMLTNKLNLAERDNHGRTALHWALGVGSPEAASLLLLAGASPTARDKHGQTALHSFARRATGNRQFTLNPPRFEEIWQLLLVTGVCSSSYLESRDFTGATALQVALCVDNLPAIKCLIQHQTSVSALNSSSSLMLHVAARHFSLDTLHYFTSLELSGIDTQFRTTAAVPGWTFSAWDIFIWCIKKADASASYASHRKAKPEIQDAFVELYQGIRDRNLQHDILRLQQALEEASRKDTVASARILASIAKEKEGWGHHDLAGWYRGIAKKMEFGDADSAMKTIEDDITCLQQEMDTSPWDQDSVYGRVY